MTEAQINHMVDRFLGWKLPEDFNPDGGISFAKTHSECTGRPVKYEPSGTNLFDIVQATAMVRYLIEGMPGSAVARDDARDRLLIGMSDVLSYLAAGQYGQDMRANIRGFQKEICDAAPQLRGRPEL